MKNLSEQLFKQLAGDRAYQKGKDYYHEDRVKGLQIEQPKITAEVVGEQTYHVVLHHTPKLFEGECSCPASNHFDFCKHCVAVALQYYYQTQLNQELADKDEPSRLLAYLNTLTKSELASQLHQQLVKDEFALDRWQLRADVASGRVNSANLRKRITKAIPYKPSGLWRYRDVSQYFEQCDANLSILETPILALEPSVAAKLVVYALQRFEKALETIEDNSHYRRDLQQRLNHWFTCLLANSMWDAKHKVKQVSELVNDTKHHYETLNLLEGVRDVLSIQEINAVILSVHQTWLSLSPDNAIYSDDHLYYTRLERVLLTHARAQQDYSTEFAILERSAVDVSRSLELVRLCIQHDKLNDANKWLDYAAKINQSNAHELYEIETTKIELWQAQERYDEALSALWARFKEQEKASLLQQLLTVAERLQERSQWLEKGIAYLNSTIIPNDLSQRNRQRAETLVMVYLDNQLFEQAMQLAGSALLSSETVMMVLQSQPKLDNSSFALLEKAINQYLDRIGQTVYQEAVDFLLQFQQKVSKSNQVNFDQLVFDLYRKPKNLRKSQFIKRLKTAFPSVLKP